MSNRGRHKKSINSSIEKLLEAIKNNNYSYRTRIKLFRDGKLYHDTTTILTFHTEKEILNWFRNVKFIFSANVMTVDKYIFNLKINNLHKNT